MGYMGSSEYPDEFYAQAQSCASFLLVIEDLLKKSNRNFDAAVVQTCVDLIHRDFVRRHGSENVVRFARPQPPLDSEEKS